MHGRTPLDEGQANDLRLLSLISEQLDQAVGLRGKLECQFAGETVEEVAVRLAAEFNALSQLPLQFADAVVEGREPCDQFVVGGERREYLSGGLP